ncbi:MAG: thiolase family protein, partial [Pseudomonadota bacterium]
MTRPASYQGVALVCPVTYGYAKSSEQTANWFIGSVLRELIASAGIKKQDIDGLAVSSFGLAPDSVSFLTQHYDMSCRWLEQLPFGGTAGVIALRRAARAVQCGDANIVACIGGDTAEKGSFAELAADFSRFSNAASYPYGSAGPNLPFALITQRYMDEYGATREDFGQIAVSQRYNAQHTSGALLGNKPLTLDDYLTARPICSPLHLYDCVMPCAGGEGFLVMSTDQAASLKLPYVTVLAADERHNAFLEDPIQLRGGWQLFRDELFAVS